MEVIDKNFRIKNYPWLKKDNNLPCSRNSHLLPLPVFWWEKWKTGERFDGEKNKKLIRWICIKKMIILKYEENAKN